MSSNDSGMDSMATILKFEMPESLQRSERPFAEHGAEIIIFPGVRYERWAEQSEMTPGHCERSLTEPPNRPSRVDTPRRSRTGTAAAPKRSRQPRKRDVLELAD